MGKCDQAINERLQSIDAEIQELFDSLSEEEKEAECVNEDKTGFINALLNKEVKQLKDDKKKGETFAKDSFETKLLSVEREREEKAEGRLLRKKSLLFGEQSKQHESKNKGNKWKKKK